MSEDSSILPSKYRSLTKGWRVISILFPVVGVVICLLIRFHWSPFGFMLLAHSYLNVVLVAFLPLAFLWIPITKNARRDTVPWYDVLIFVLSLLPPLYAIANQWPMQLQGWGAGAPTVGFILAVVLFLVMLEGARRAGGPVVAIVILVFALYPMFGPYMPGFLETSRVSFHRLMSYQIFGDQAVFGIILRVTGSLIIGFMAFAVTIQALGAGRFFKDLAMALVGNTRAGNAKVAIIASGFFGSISGSATANVMTSGAFTIPAMKKEGLHPDFAGAVEACASAGGALMPPVMGATAFIMAEFLEIPYIEICIVAAVPSVLYYLTLFSQIDSYAGRLGLKPKPLTVEVPPVWRTLLNNLHIIIAFIFLIAMLFLYRLSAQGPWMASGVLIVLAMFRKETRLNLKGFIGLFEHTGRVLGELIAICAPLGLIIGSLILTGTAFTLPNEIVHLAGGNLVLMLIFGALAAFILGMGVTISATYIFLALVLCPGLVMGGFDLLAVHLFVLYCAMMSHITPPVAIAAFAAATISGGDPMKTGFNAMKLGVAKYILPFVFVFSPALILRGTASEALMIIPSVAIGLVIISGALEGYFWRLGNLTILGRVLLFGAGMSVIFFNLGTTLYGIGGFIVIFGLAYLMRERSRLVKAPV